MAAESTWTIGESDRGILRDLAKHVCEISQEPVMAELRRRWQQHASLRGERPMVLAEAGGVMHEVMPDENFHCQGDWARDLERTLRMTIFQHEQVGDDQVVDAVFNCPWQVSIGDYGVTVEMRRGDNNGAMGSCVWDAPIKDIQKDFDKLHPRTFSVDREATAARKAALEQLFDGILPVRIRGSFWWTMGLTWSAIKLIGLENLMLFMYDDPEGLHRLMAFLRDDHIALARWCEAEGLLTLNNASDYVGSGGHGYTTELPQAGYVDGEPARMKDLWVLSESQETVGVGPEQFAEFVFPYQLPIVEMFGLTYYGCCEPVHSRWHVIKQIPNLRSVSVSPWCDEEMMAEALRGRYVYCRKPNPAMISTPRFDDDAIRQDIRHTLELTGPRNVEFAMKDVHTLSGDPARLGRWVRLAREVIDEFV